VNRLHRTKSLLGRLWIATKPLPVGMGWLLLLLTGLTLLLAGCDEVARLFPQQVDVDEPLAFISPETETVYPASMATAARIQARGVLVVGVRYDLEPFSYITTDSQLVGLEIDLARELARRWLGSSELVRFRQIRSDTAYRYLTDGLVDVAFGGLEHTQEAEMRADFSPPYFTNGMALLTFPDTTIQSRTDLGGKRVGVVTWTDSSRQITTEPEITATLVPYANFYDVVQALRTREIDAYADRRHRLERARRMVAGTGIAGQWTEAPVAMIYRHDDPLFANLVRLTFEDMVVDGTRDALYSRWLPGTSPPMVRLLPGVAPAPRLAEMSQQMSTLDMLGRIRDRGFVRVGYYGDRWPYSADRADGVPTGFELRLLERMVETWLGSSTAMQYIPITSEAEGLQRLAQGEVDLLVGNWIHTRELELLVDGSIPIIDDGVGILSLAATPIQELSQLAGQPVAVVAGSAAEAAVAQLSRGVGLSAVGYVNLDAALAALQSREILAVLSERQPALAVQFRETGFFFTDRRYTYRPVVLVVPEGDSEFLDLVNLTLMSLEARGIYQELYELWFDDPTPSLQPWPGRPSISLTIQR
jgi:aspartate/glutamate/glutamine transport system substrate-binding protein